MGQTLTHGIYLPDEGERNCYNGLAANWSILDGAVGTIAEHTSALAGKAPLVHTHTKSDITDFPAYGTTAGTICEGNDSRLSDARTPVAHTHTKSDVTDLLNSNFIPSANNSYDLGSSSYQWNKIYSADVVHTSGNETITGVKTFSNSLSINGSSPRLQTKSTTYSSATSSGMTIGDIAFLNKDGGFSAWIVHQLRDDLTKRLCFRVYPHTSTTYRGFVFDDTCTLYPENGNSALGSSSYQWNNIYAKNYYYNGTAWGLDKANVWSTYNTFTGDARPIRLRGSNNDIYNVQPQSAVYSQIDFVDKNNETMSYILFQHRADATETHRLCLRQKRITLDAYYSVNLNNLGDFYPEQSNAINLGTSNNKWKTLNGINPGALSLPSSHYVEIGTDGWDLSGATYNRVYINNVNPTFPGILFIRINSTTATDILVRLFATSGQEISYVGSKIEAGSNNMIVTVPCPPSTNIYVSIKTSSTIYTCRYYTLLGDPEFDSRSGS